MNFQLVSALMRGVWLIPPDVAESYSPAIGLLLSGQPAEFDFEDFRVQIFNPEGRQQSGYTDNIFDNVQPGAVVSIPVKGALMKNDQMCGPVGMKSLGNIIQQADANPNVKGIVLEIDSPGGTADGTARLADIVKGVSKPTVAYVDGMAASAAYWIASAADRIVAEPRSTIGSIGTMMSFPDLQPAFEEKKVKFHKIVSNLSPDKNGLFEQVRSGNYDEYRKNVLDPLATDFIEAIKTNRPQVTGDQLTGKTYFAADLVGTMVDQTGSIEDAIKLIDQPEQVDYSKPNITQTMKQFQNLNRVLNVDSLEMTDEGIFLNQDQIEAINAALEPAPAAIAPEPEPAPDPTPATPGISEEAMNIINDLRARLEAVENSAGAPAAVVAPATDPGKPGPKLASDPNADFWENVNRVKQAYM